MTAPEFSRLERSETIGDAWRQIAIEADAVERVALAERFGLLAIDRLAASLAVRRDAMGIVVNGRVEAAVTQACAVTGDPIAVIVDEPVALRFVSESDAAEDELELSDAEIDVIGYDDGAIDLGEAAAETMALALDPFPRAPGAEQTLKQAGVLSEEEAGPFGALAALKDRLASR